uniref:GP-PDE domain-containing protein n=1 Tax=Knipowitschia caucasica TaxID=637954 RepID=A0AAV2KJ21_KNICA
MPISIEIKEENQQLIQKVSDLVKLYDRESITVWASLSSSIIKKCLETNNTLPFSFSMKRGVVLLLLFYSGLLPFVPIHESLLQFYLPRVMNRTFIPDQRILRNRLVVCLLEIVTMRKSLFKHLADRGIQVHLFVCNTDEDITAALELGATGVMTDYPSLLSNYFYKDHPQKGAGRS